MGQQKKKQSSSSNKSIRIGDLRVEDKAPDQAQLERDFDPSGPKSDHKVVTCYNSACPDYRRPRNDGSSCGCKRTAIGAT